MTKGPIKLPAPVFDDPRHHIRLYQGDCLELLPLIPESSVGLIFADKVQIREGLNEGDLVVVRAGSFLREGDEVRPVLPEGKK